jgi:hypothetical protein
VVLVRRSNGGPRAGRHGGATYFTKEGVYSLTGESNANFPFFLNGGKSFAPSI